MATSTARVLRTRRLYTGLIFALRKDTVIEPGGIRVVRDIVEHPGAIVLLPLLANRRIVMVRQYRHAARKSLWELVAGRLEPGEPPLAAARRELLEETGYTARRFRKLLEFLPAPGYTSERMLIYTAEHLTPGRAQPEDDERLTVRSFTLPEILSRIRRGSITDGKTLAGILYYSAFCARPR